MIMPQAPRKIKRPVRIMDKGYLKKYIFYKRTALITSLAVFASFAMPQCVIASPLEALNLLAGEARAIQGETVSYDSLDREDMTVSEESYSTNTVIRISSAADLADLAKKADLDTYTKNKTFVLTCDIDLVGSGFKTIPVFSGVFDGQGHNIRGLTYYGTGYVTGLFRYISQGAIVKDLTVYGNISAVDDEEITGGICGINEGVISNCSFRGVIKGRSITGGVVAINEVPGTVLACTNEASVTGYYYTGGITGKNYGVTAYCENRGPVNTTVEWVEGSDAFDPGENIISAFMNGGIDVEDGNSIRTTAGVDTGGIAGYSRGAIHECRNIANVGYEHAGYNVGGIVGRQAGFVSYCFNQGTIYGRKDIGGIVGQMEPYLTLTDLETLPEAVDKLHDLVDVSIDDMDASVGVISDDVKQLSAYADNAVTSSDALGDSAEIYLNSVSDAANSLQSRVDYLTEKMPRVFEYLSDAGDSLSDSGDNLKKFIDDANVYKRIASSPEETVSINDARKRARSRDLPVVDRIEATEEILSIVVPETVEAGSTISGNTRRLHDSVSDVADNIEEGMDYSKDVVEHINSMSKPTAPYLGSDFDAARNSLADNLSGMSKMLSVLAEHSDLSSGQVSDDLSEVNDQINVVFHIIADQLDRIGNFTKGESDDIVTDVSEEDIGSIMQGRVDNSENIGNVEGDINIGGIAGGMSIDTDDPEENAAGDMTGGFTAKYLLRNIILDCRNDSYVISKKDGAGGIAGFMEQGIIKGCESYGYVESTEGGYVGGISGQSMSVIKDSYAMNFITGNSYTGGIAGFGTTINGCTSFPVFEKESNRQGAVAGQIDTDPDSHLKHLEAVSGNRFVNDVVAGIDGVSIAGRAEPVRYQSITSDINTPDEFKNIRVIFRVDEDKPSQVSVPYGTKVTDIAFPMTMPSDGEYVEWEEHTEKETVTEPLIIRGKKKQMEKTLMSGELYPGTDMPAALLSGSFVGTDTLTASVTDEDTEIYYDIAFVSDYSKTVEAIRLYDPFGKSAIYGIADDGSDQKLEGSTKGSYIEVRGDLEYKRYRIEDKGIIDKAKRLLSSIFDH